MARILAPDYIGGDARLSVNGDEARRLFLVGELTGAPASRMIDACLAPGVPRKGQAHPTYAGLSVLDVTARPHQNDAALAMVEVLYQPPSAFNGGGSNTVGTTTVNVQTDLIVEETIFDIFGRKIGTVYTITVVTSEGTLGDGGSTRTIKSQRTHRIEVERPTFALVYTRVENRSALAVAREYAGTVNSSPFLGFARDTLLCTVSSDQSAAAVHNVRYQFTHNPNGWQATTVYNDRGVIPDDVSVANGIATWLVYPRKSFAALGLPPV